MSERILIDPGAVGHEREVDITHAWATELAKQINKLGGDTYVLPDGWNSNSDLAVPVNIANAYGKPWLYVSIHANAGGGTGAEIYIHDDVWCDPSTSNLAHSVFNAYMSVAKKHGLSSRGVKARYFYYMNRRSKNSQFIELHKSTRFY